MVTCNTCYEVMSRLYPVHFGVRHHICMQCGIGDPNLAIGSYVLILHGVYICLCGEQLLNPSWYCSQLLSTSPVNLDVMRRMATLWSGKELPRRTKTMYSLPVAGSSVSVDGTGGEVYYARVMCTISVICLGCNSVQVVCPVPEVASSTATVSDIVRTSPHADEAWRAVSGSADESPLTVSEGSLSTGRTTESAVGITSPEWVREGAVVICSTYMTRLTFIVDHDEQYGMSKDSLRELSGIMVRHYDRSIWCSVVREAHKVTLRSVHGPAVVLTYTGIVSLMGAPSGASATFSAFMDLITLSFRDSTSVSVLAHLRRVVKPRWSVAISQVY